MKLKNKYPNDLWGKKARDKAKKEAGKIKYLKTLAKMAKDAKLIK